MKTAQEWADDAVNLMENQCCPKGLFEQAMTQAREQALEEAAKVCDEFKDRHSHTIESWDTAALLWERIRALKAKR